MIDMDCGIANWLLKFADDAKLFGKIQSDAGQYQRIYKDCLIGPRSGKWNSI